MFSGHTDAITSLAFSQDGTLLASGSDDKTMKLWDAQTGGAVKTLSDHNSAILSVSISLDCTMVVSGSRDGTIHLWNVRTGERLRVMHHWSEVTAVSFQPTDSRRFISSSVDSTVRQWDVDGHLIGPPYLGVVEVTHVAYSSDGTRFVSCGGTVATVRDSISGRVLATLHVKNRALRHGCFSPDGIFVACAAGETIHVWDITSAQPRLIGDFVGHTKDIISMVFSSSLISGSKDRSVKFWKISPSQTLADSITTDDEPTPLALAAIESVNLFTEEGVAVTSDLSGVVKTWDIATGRCKSSFSTPAKGTPRDIHLANDNLVVVWYEQGGPEGGECHIWDIGKGQDLLTVDWPLGHPLDLRVSGDGSKVFLLSVTSIRAFSMQTGEFAGRAGDELDVEGLTGPLIVHGSKVWLSGTNHMGWEFGGPGVSPLPLSDNEFPDQPRLDFVDQSTQNGIRPAWIQDTGTGNLVFRLPERYMKPSTKMRWDGWHLVVGCPSGEVVIMDFSQLNPQ